MRIIDKSILSEDEELNISQSVANKVLTLLENINLDSYNEQYVIRITVDKVDKE